WPLDATLADTVYGLLAIHELRTHEDRVAWFGEARRCLSAGGRVVIAEHVRDFANFLAFGPGFVHFHSEGTWRRSWEAAGFRLPARAVAGKENGDRLPLVLHRRVELPHPALRALRLRAVGLVSIGWSIDHEVPRTRGVLNLAKLKTVAVATNNPDLQNEANAL